jgi:transcriptional regulator with XRE-family HTH domain
MARPHPPPYAQLIARSRLAPPKMTITEAARRAGISDTRWSQLENGYRMNRGHAEPEWAPADTLAHMARAVGVTPAQLQDAARDDAAAELAALPAAIPEAVPDFAELARSYQELAEAQRRVEEKLDRVLRDREPNDKEDPHEANGSRRAG